MSIIRLQKLIQTYKNDDGDSSVRRKKERVGDGASPISSSPSVKITPELPSRYVGVRRFLPVKGEAYVGMLNGWLSKACTLCPVSRDGRFFIFPKRSLHYVRKSKRQLELYRA